MSCHLLRNLHSLNWVSRIIHSLFSWIVGVSKQWGKLFLPGSVTKFGTNALLFGGIRRSGLRIVVSGTVGRSEGLVERPDGERVPRSYVWPDKKVELNFFWGYI